MSIESIWTVKEKKEKRTQTHTSDIFHSYRWFFGFCCVCTLFDCVSNKHHKEWSELFISNEFFVFMCILCTLLITPFWHIYTFSNSFLTIIKEHTLNKFHWIKLLCIDLIVKTIIKKVLTIIKIVCIFPGFTLFPLSYVYSIPMRQIKSIVCRLLVRHVSPIKMMARRKQCILFLSFITFNTFKILPKMNRMKAWTNR